MPEQEIFTEDFEEKEKARPKKEKDNIVKPESPVLNNTEPNVSQTGFFSRIRDWVKQTFEKVKETLKHKLPSLNKPGGFLDRVETRVFGGKEAYNKLYIPDNAVVTQKENRISELTKEEPKSKEEKREERDKLQASKQFERYKTLAEKGDIESCLRLGDCYHRGTVKMGDKTVSIDGLSQDPKLEFDYYKKAFELSGGKEGAILLGRCYEHGYGTEVNLSKAKELYAPYDSELKQFEARYPDLQKQNNVVNPDIFNDSSDVDLLKNDNQTNILENTKNLRTIDVFESSVSGRLLTDTEGKEYLYVNHDNETVTVIPIETDENGNSFSNPDNKLNLPSDQIVSVGQTKNISLESAQKANAFIADEIRKDKEEKKEGKREQEEIEEAGKAADAVEEVFNDIENAEKIEEELSEEIADSEKGFVPPEYEEVIEAVEDAENEDVDVVESVTDSQSEISEFEIDEDGVLTKEQNHSNIEAANKEDSQSEIEKGDILEGSNGNHYLYTGALKKEPDKCWLQKVEYDDSQKVWKTTGERSFKEKVDKLDDYKIERKAFGDFQKGDDAYDYEGNHGTISRIKNNIITFEYDNGTKLDCFATELQKSDNDAISVEEKSEIPEESKHIKETFVTEEKQENDFFTADTQNDSFSLEDMSADEQEEVVDLKQSFDSVAIEEIEDF